MKEMKPLHVETNFGELGARGRCLLSPCRFAFPLKIRLCSAALLGISASLPSPMSPPPSFCSPILWAPSKGLTRSRSFAEVHCFYDLLKVLLGSP
jgi:hypothetical protein